MSSINAGIWEGLSIHPNPVVDEFSIELPNLNQKLDVSIFDSQSKLIEKFNINSINKINVDMSTYSSGIYFIKLNSSESTYDFKIIKE